jgi:hypothetical protein
MADLEREMRKERDNQDMLLKQKLKDRGKKDKKAIKEVGKREKD